MTPRYSTGNAMTEHALIGLLVAAVGFTGLMQLGGAIQGQFSAFQQSLARPSEAEGNISDPILANGNAGSGNGTGGNNNAGGGIAGGSSNGGSPMVNGGTQETKSLIQVSGANGATKAMLALMRARIDELANQGAISAEEANLLIELANRGHKIAAAQKVFEDALLNKQATAQFDGVTYQLNQFNNVIGFEMAPDPDGYWQVDGGASQTSATAEFVRAYQAALHGGALNNPAVKKEISELAFQIGSLADAVSWEISNMAEAGKPFSEWGQNIEQYYGKITSNFEDNLGGIPPDLRPTVEGQPPSTITDQNSGQICTVGNGQDSGTQCSPN